MNENWSIKLQVNGGGTPLFNEWELVYKSAQTVYKLTQGKMSITGQEPAVVTHQSDNSAAVLSRAIEQNKTLAFEISILDNVHTAAAFDWDVALNNVHTLARHLSGATSTAVRSASGGKNVRIAIKPYTATLTTYYDVQWGKVDTSASYYMPESQQGSTQVGTKGAWFCPVTLTLKDGGYGDSFTLRNDLPSSPHFIEDSNSDGLADGWTENGAPTTSIDTFSCLVGGKSQKVVAAAAFEGVFSSSINSGASTTVAAFVWAHVSSGSAAAVLVENPGGAFIVAKDILELNSSGTFVGQNGTIWLKIDLSANVTAGKSYSIYVIANAASTFFIDAAYLEVGGGTTAPLGWCSSSSLKNRYDPAATSAATQQQINYLDVWGVPGDLPAWVESLVSPDALLTSDNAILVVGKEVEGATNPAGSTYKKEGESFLLPAGWSSVADAARSEGAYLRNANAGTAATTTSAFGLGQISLLQKAYRAYVIGRTSHISASISLSVENISTGTYSFSAINIWEMVDIGLVNLTGLVNRLSSSSSVGLSLTATAAAASNIDIDVIYFIPTDELLIFKQGGTAVASMNIYLDGSANNYYNSRNYLNTPVLGEMRNCFPLVMNRYIVNTYAADGSHSLGTTCYTQLTITPRTSHLLGTM